MPLPLRYQWSKSNSNLSFQGWLEQELLQRQALEEEKILQSGEAPHQQLKAKISEFRESLEWYRDNENRNYANGFLNKLDEIQKLSAV